MSAAENGLGVVLNIFQGNLYNLNYRIKNSVRFILNLNDIKKENETLVKDNNNLKDKSLKYDDLVKENERLKKMLNFKDQRTEYNYLGCDIIGKSGDNWLDGFVINRGSDDGLKDKMIVMTGEGLVGQVTTVGSNWAIVQSLINENIAVAATVSTTRENDGVVKGYRDDNDRLLAKLYYLPLDSQVKEGDIIFTSGLGGLYPKDIKIGSVISIEEDKGKLIKNALIEPSVNFNKLEELFVIIPKNQREVKY